MVIGSAVHNFFDPIDSIEEYMEVVESAEKGGIGQFSNNFMCCRPCFGQWFVNETPGQLETEEKAWLEDWDSDIEFGRQTLNGMNPGCIQRWAQVLDFGG